MLMQIGQKPDSDFKEPIGMLEDCHKRILYFLNDLTALAETAEALSDNRRKSLEAGLKYFREGAPRHTADEEESLFPQLRRLPGPQMRSVFTTLASLEGDHRWADERHREVDAIGSRWLAEGDLSQGERLRLKALLEALLRVYERHIALEETEVFSAAKVLLSVTEKETLGKEMASRREIVLRNENGNCVT